MASTTDRYLEYLSSERRAGHLYRALSQVTTGERAEALAELASIEDKHAAHWIELLEQAGVAIPPDDGSLKPSDEELLKRARAMSLDAVLPDLEQAERDAQGVYDNEPGAAPGMADDERVHERVLAGMQRGEGGPPVRTEPGESRIDRVREQLNRSEPWHRTDKSGSLRAAVFGVSDGLVSNTALVMGFAGSGTGQGTVLFAGLAGLLAGAFSMGAGEYVSVASQRDIFGREIRLEAKELEEKPLEEQRELELIYRAKGLDRATAKEVAAKIIADPDVALDTLAREELGLDPSELGSPIKVAVSSFAAFAVGAIVPVIPYFFAGGQLALVIAIVLAVLALLAVGGVVGRISGLGMTKSALRQLAVGGGAAAVTYLVGSLVGGAIS